MSRNETSLDGRMTADTFNKQTINSSK